MQEGKKTFKHFDWVETEDGSFTLRSHEFDETLHSTAGAELETRTQYIEGCKICDLQHVHKENLTILEVGLGLGIGFFETKKFLKDNFFTFITLEKDQELISEFLKNFKSSHEENIYGGKIITINEPAFKLIVLEGDATLTLPSLLPLYKNKIHAIYQDAFSPKKNEELWTISWFKILKELSHKGCRLSTYSSSTKIRFNMYEAGWIINNSAGLGAKRSSTRASLEGITDKDILKRVLNYKEQHEKNNRDLKN